LKLGEAWRAVTERGELLCVFSVYDLAHEFSGKPIITLHPRDQLCLAAARALAKRGQQGFLKLSESSGAGVLRAAADLAFFPEVFEPPCVPRSRGHASSNRIENPASKRSKSVRGT
jgi:hypothetical protein